MKKLNTNNILRIALTGALSIITACSGGGGNSSPTPTDLQDRFQGNWERQGYGYVINVSGSEFTAYDFTSSTCVRHGKDSLAALTQRLDELSTDNLAFTLRDAPIGFVETYYRREDLPGACRTPIDASPEKIYEHVWHTFNEHYAFLQERGVDWLAQYDATRDRVSNDMSDQALFELLRDLVAPIDDVHVSIFVDDEISFSPGTPNGFFDEFTQEFEAQDEIDSIEAYFAQELGLALSIIDDVYLGTEVNEAGGASGDFFKWGKIGEEIGYLSVGAFILGFDRAISDQLVDVEEVIDRVLTDLASTSAIIIDVRLTPGGADPIALSIANRFADVERLAVTKYARTNGEDGGPQAVSVEPSSRINYAKPAVVLTSGFSASATETFVLSMRGLPHVTVVGERTIGALSDILEKPLPNGWQLGLANEVYVDADGKAYEAIGIPPHIEVSAFGKEAREIGQDSALNVALSVLGFGLSQ